MRTYGILAGAAAFAAATPAASAITIFTDRAAFEAAAGAISTVTFNDFTSDTGFGAAALDVGPFSLSIANNASALVSQNAVQVAPFPADPQNYDVDGTPFALFDLARVVGNSPATGTLTFDNAIRAVGFDTRSLSNSIVTQIFFDGTNTGLTGSNDQQALLFFGFISDVDFSTVQFTRMFDSNDRFGIDNVSFSTSAAVPEPGTWLMMIAGFGAVGGMLRRRPARPLEA